MKKIRKLEKPTDLKILLEQQHVSYPKKWLDILDTYENVIFKKENLKERKPRIDTIWKNYRIYLYGKTRLIDCKNVIADHIKKSANDCLKFYVNWSKNPKSEKLRGLVVDKIYELTRTYYLLDGAGIEKIGGKSKYREDFRDKIFRDKFKSYVLPLAKIKNVNEEELANSRVIKRLKLLKHEKKDNLKTIIKFPSKIDTVKKILKDEFYWKQRERAFKKPSGDRNDISKFRKEKQDFYKCTMKIYEKEYDKIFFIKYEPKAKHYWKEYWGLFLEVR